MGRDLRYLVLDAKPEDDEIYELYEFDDWHEFYPHGLSRHNDEIGSERFFTADDLIAKIEEKTNEFKLKRLDADPDLSDICESITVYAFLLGECPKSGGVYMTYN